MKIAILTFHYACNYGAVLQAYALRKYLCSKGCEVDIADYRPESVAGGYRWFDIRRFWGKTPAKFLSKTRRELGLIAARKARYGEFGRFVAAELSLAAPAALKDYDLVIVGSDQVWNKELTEGFDPLYWGKFERGEGSSIISYAASLGPAEGLTDLDATAIAFLLKNNFSGISFREKSSMERLREKMERGGNREVADFARSGGFRVDMDPVFLLGRDEWSALADWSNAETSSPYLFYYSVKPSDEAFEFAKKTAAERGLRLVCLSAKLEGRNDRDTIESSPEDFLKLMRDASYVVTTSFHGTAFSLVFGKEFKSFNASGDSRIDDLLSSGESLSERISSSESYLDSFLR